MSFLIPPSTPPSRDDLKAEEFMQVLSQNPLREMPKLQNKSKCIDLANKYLNNAEDVRKEIIQPLEAKVKSLSETKGNFFQKAISWISSKVFSDSSLTNGYGLKKGYENLASTLMKFEYVKAELNSIPVQDPSRVKLTETVNNLLNQHPAMTLNPSDPIDPSTMQDVMQKSYDNLIKLEYELREEYESIRTQLLPEKQNLKVLERQIYHSADQPLPIKELISQKKSLTTHITQLEVNLKRVKDARIGVSKLRQSMGKDLSVQFLAFPKGHSIFQNLLPVLGLNAKLGPISDRISALEDKFRAATSPSVVKTLSYEMHDLLKERQKILMGAIYEVDHATKKPETEGEKLSFLETRELLNRAWTENDFINELYEANVQQFDNEEKFLN